MSQKVYVVLGVVCIVLMVILMITYVRPEDHNALKYNGVGSDAAVRVAGVETFGTSRTSSHRDTSGQLEELGEVTRALLKQRNDISRELNQKQQRLGQIACEKLGTQQVKTSETGGWCQKSSTEGGGNHMTDRPLATALANFFQGKRVASFGDGPGRYKQLLTDSGKVKGYDAYDGAPYCDKTSEGRVKFLDLTLPQFGLPLYDWVMSLEVAEHIPQQYESIYVDNVVRHAREGVVISWAVPGQGGYSHVNNRSFDYVKKLFEGLGFDYDEKASTELKTAATFGWLKTNTAVFRRRDTAKIDRDSLHFT